MYLKPVNVSVVMVDIEEAAVVRRKLVERTYSPAIASHIAAILHQLSASNRLELGGIALVAFNAVLNDIIADHSTSNGEVLLLQPLLHRVQTEVTNRYHEITQQS